MKHQKNLERGIKMPQNLLNKIDYLIPLLKVSILSKI